MLFNWLKKIPEPINQNISWTSQEIILFGLGRFSIALWLREAFVNPIFQRYLGSDSFVFAITQILMVEIMWNIPEPVILHANLAAIECLLAFICTGLIIAILNKLPTVLEILKVSLLTVRIILVAVCRTVTNCIRRTNMAPFRRYMASTFELFTESDRPSDFQERLHTFYHGNFVIPPREVDERDTTDSNRPEVSNRSGDFRRTGSFGSPRANASPRTRSRSRRRRHSSTECDNPRFRPRQTRSGTVFGYTYDVDEQDR